MTTQTAARTAITGAAVTLVTTLVAIYMLGVGTAGSLVASLAVYARRFPPDRFATLTGMQVGIGTIGTLIATAPLAFSTATIGWRNRFLVVAVFTWFAAFGFLAAIARC